MSRTTDIAWLAGLFEGEGSIIRSNSRGYEYWQMTLVSTDFDVLDRVLRVAGVGGLGKVRRDPKNPHYKPYRVWSVTKRIDIMDILSKLRPHLCERRGAKADEFFEHFRTWQPQNRKPGHCRRGHKMVNPIVVQNSGRPTCRICTNARARNRRANGYRRPSEKAVA